MPQAARGEVSRDRQEFRAYCRLALRVATPEFRAMLEVKAIDPDEGVRRRARWVLQRFHPGRTWLAAADVQD